jgi:hypothetical protein
MARKAFGLLLSLVLAVSWAGPLCAMPMGASHACCPGGEAPKGDLPACCLPTVSVPAASTAALQPPAPVILQTAAPVADAPRARWGAPSPFVPASPQPPPGTHSGLSPPSSGL